MRRGHQPRPTADAAQLGGYLAEARRRAGLERGEVDAYFGVPERCVELIEAGRFDALPNPVHARGYVRCLACALGLDQENLTLALTRALGGSGIVDASLACLRECVQPQKRGAPRPGVRTVEPTGASSSGASRDTSPSRSA